MHTTQPAITQEQFDNFVAIGKLCFQMKEFIEMIGTTVDRVVANHAAMATDLTELKLEVAALRFGRDSDDMKGEA